MSLKNTNLVLVAANLPDHFQGTPQQYFAAILARMKIMSPAGTTFFVISDAEPTSNQGPWLKEGKKWYVFDEATKRYVPLDISDSDEHIVQTGSATPTTSLPPIWLRTTTTGKPIAWYFWDGTAWTPDMGIVQSGTTAQRPTNPVALQQFYDESIGCLIWYERDAWRTVAGSPGEVKHVVQSTLTEALRFNPGWEVLGAEQQSYRGRVIWQATKDSGDDPETTLTVDSGVAQRAAHEVFGETDGIKMDSTSDVPYPPSLALWTLVKT